MCHLVFQADHLFAVVSGTSLWYNPMILRGIPPIHQPRRRSTGACEKQPKPLRS